MNKLKAGQMLQVAENWNGALYVRETTKGEWHPLVEVPAHGRLIDADLLYDKWIWGSTDRAAETKCIELIDLSLAPTVLEASEVPTVIEAEDSND